MKTYTRPIIITYVILTVLLLVLTPFDLRISAFLYGEGTRPTHYMVLSELTYLPTFFIGLFGVYYYCHRFKSYALQSRLKQGIWLLLTGLLLLLLFIMFYRSLRFMPGTMRLYFAPIFYLILNIYGHHYGRKAVEHQWFHFDYLASIGLLLIGIQYFTVTVLKRLVGRARFYVVFEDESLFTPWFVIQEGIATQRDFYSIPSGHTSFAAISLWFIVVAMTVPVFKKYLKPTAVVVGFWIFLQAFLRVFSGEHFATDVIFSVIYTFTVTLVLYVATKELRRFIAKKYNI